MAEYLLYKRIPGSENATLTLPEGMALKEQTVSLKDVFLKKVSAYDILWYFISLGKYKTYIVTLADGKRVHRSNVIGKCIKFPFLPEGAYEIGPCATEEEFRGQGVYPYVLEQICKRNPNDFYMVVLEDNLSSVRGIEKAGFERVGKVSRNKLGIWRKQ